ncbi:unnamed protein product [Ectocarpus sp. 12 AP-2014]
MVATMKTTLSMLVLLVPLLSVANGKKSQCDQVNKPVGCECATDDECADGLTCCEEVMPMTCVNRGNGQNGPNACGDPHMTGFLGQKFDFTGEDGGYYALVSDFPNMHMNMRVTSPVPSLPEITYITGLSLLTTDVDGEIHSIVIEVKNPHDIESSCPAGVSPCLADGSLRVILDGKEELSAPGSVALADDVKVTAVNLPGECRSFGFERYWELKKLENALHGRHLSELSMGAWLLGDPTATNMDECAEYVSRAEVQAGGLFAHQSEHASFKIVTPTATIRLSHGRLHQIATRDPTDRFDLPDHTTWQMNMGVDHNEVSYSATGILGETSTPTTDANGEDIMTGMKAIRGSEEDYRVTGPLDVTFAMDTIEL